MSLQWIFGRAATGKTTRLFETLAQTWHRSMRTTPMWLIVPEQMVYDIERRLTMQFGALMHVQILSFHRLAERIALSYGSAARGTLDDTGKAMLLTHVLQRTPLRVGKKGWGWATHVLEAMHECTQSCVTTEQLRAWADEVAPMSLKTKLRDLADTFDEVDACFARHRLADVAQLRDLARTILEQPSLSRAHVWIDGFHGFTPAEELVLKSLLLREAHVTIALTYPGPHHAGADTDWFSRPARTVRRIEHMARDVHCTIAPPIVCDEVQALCPALQQLECRWVQEGCGMSTAPHLPSLYAHDALPPLTVYEAADAHAEVEALARYIDDCARRGVRYRDIAVVTRQWDDVKAHIDSVFPLLNIPYYIDEKQSAAHHPLALLVYALLDIAASSRAAEPIFRAMKTELFVAPPPGYTYEQWRDAIDRFEHVALWIGLRDERWWEPMQPYVTDEACLLCQQALCTRLERIARWTQSTTLGDWARGLWACLEEWDVDLLLQRLSVDAHTGAIDAVHETMWNSVCDLLEQLVMLMGEDEADLAHFSDVLRGGIQQLTLGTVPPSLEHVLIAHVDRSRLPRVRVVCWVGLNDGVMPAKRRDGNWLGEWERRALAQRFGDVLGPDQARILREEPYVFYVHTFVAREALWIGTHRIGVEGTSCRPSEWIERLRHWMPEHTALCDAPPQWNSLPFVWEHVRTPAWTQRMLLRALQAAASGHTIHGAWWTANNVLAPVYALTESVGTERLSQQAAHALYGRVVRSSVSQLETYALCSFAHFAKYGLRLQQRKQYRIERPDIGLIAHEVLASVIAQMIDHGTSLRTIDADALQALVVHHVQAQLATYRQQFFARTGRARHTATLIERLLVRTLRMMQQQELRGQFDPLATEVVFGPNGQMPPLTVPLQDDGQLVLSGRIDRIDALVGDRRYVRVIDYKSRPKKLHWSDVWHGVSLQLLTYAYHVETAGPRVWHTPWILAGALYAPVYHPLLAVSDASVAQEELLKKYKMRGVLRNDVVALTAMDGQSSKTSPIIPVSWQGDRQQATSRTMEVLNSTQWEAWTMFLRWKLAALGEHIRSGHIAAHPRRTADHTLACDTCAMHAVCGFDPERHRIREQRLTVSEVWERMTAMGKDDHSDDAYMDTRPKASD
jgi:ATP-dependent helicase/nuclease subunit B